MLDAEKLKLNIRVLRKMQNREQKKYGGIESYDSYYTGYMSALSTVEGIIAEMENEDEANRRDCKQS